MTRDGCAKAAQSAYYRGQYATLSDVEYAAKQARDWEHDEMHFPGMNDRWRAVADAIGPRCHLSIKVADDDSEHTHYRPCTLPAWHDHTKGEMCR